MVVVVSLSSLSVVLVFPTHLFRFGFLYQLQPFHLLNLFVDESGSFQLDQSNDIIKSILTTHKGDLVQPMLVDRFHVKG